MANEKQNQTQSAPYEVPLTKAFDKLTSQIFIFLLAYVILLIGLAVFGENLANSIKVLLYMIPILGVAAYVWQNQKKIRGQARKSGIDVSAWRVTSSGRVVAVNGAKSGDPIPENVKIRVGSVSQNAEVGGVVYGTEESGDTSENYLLGLFAHLDERNRRELITSAQTLLDKQAAPK